MAMLMLTILFAQDTELSVITMDGQSISGRPVSLDTERLQIETATGVQTISIENLSSLRRNEESLPARETRRIVLRDGSRLAFEKLEARSGEFRLESDWLGNVSIPFTAVQAIRLQDGLSKFGAQWTALKERDASSELLVLKKRDESGLDFLPGNLSYISDDTIGFVIAGDEVPVPVTRVFGIVMRQVESGYPTGTCQVKFRDEMFPAESVVLDGDSVTVTSSLLGTRSLGLTSFGEIDFASGRLQFLSAVPTISSEYIVAPDSAAGSDEQLASLFRIQFRPRMNETMDKGEPLRLGGRQYRNGIWMCSNSQASWALDGVYASLEASVGIDEVVTHKGDRQAQLIVEADGQVVVDIMLKTTGSPQQIEVPLDGVQTLTVMVKDGGDGTQLDWVDLANARLIRAGARAGEGN